MGRLFSATAWGLVFVQIFIPVFFAISSVSYAANNNSLEETLLGLEALIEKTDQVNDFRPASEGLIGETSAKDKSSKKSAVQPLSATEGVIRLESVVDDISILPSLTGKSYKNSEDRDVQESTDNSSSGMLAPGVIQVAQILSESNVSDATINYAKSIGEGLINQQINDWLSQRGTGRISINSKSVISGDILFPLLDDPESLLFTQFGMRNNDSRNIVNVGLGYRQIEGDWMYGANSFYDHDLTGKNSRFGLGGEAWTDYLKLSANGYFRLTNWHQSGAYAMQDYDERPANGFDLRADAWLPFYPQVGGSLKYEKYFGKGVALSGSSSVENLRDNPSSVSVGINYTPFPLITVKGEFASGDKKNSSIGLDVTYRPGVPWRQQIDTDSVDMLRSLMGSKYDLVDRNYNIVMQYLKQKLLIISLPERVSARASENIRLSVSVHKAKYGLHDVEWTTDADFYSSGGMLRVLSATEVEIKLPAYIYNYASGVESPQEYRIKAIGVDNNGNKSEQVSTLISIQPSKNIISSLTVSPAGEIVANNSDDFTAVALVHDEDNRPLGNQVITFSLLNTSRARSLSGITLFNDNQSSDTQLIVNTDAYGKALIRLRSKKAQEATILARMENGNYKTAKVKFIADRSTARISDLKIIQNNAVANGRSTNELFALVTDANGNAVEGIIVNLSANNGAEIITEPAITGIDGKVSIKLTNTRAGESVVTVSTNGTEKTQTVKFISDMSMARGSIQAEQDIIANGIASSLITETVTDTNGNIIAGATVQFSANNGATITPAMGITNHEGVVTARLSSRKAATITVIAKIKESGNTNREDVRFIADISTSRVSELVVIKNDAKADGTDTNKIKVKITDAANNLVSGADVRFSADNNAILSDFLVSTNAQGEAEVTLTNIKAVQVKVNVSVNNTQKSALVKFIADEASAILNTDSLTITRNNAKADNISSNEIKAQVVDARGNPVPGVLVNFTATNQAKVSIPAIKTNHAGIATITLTSVVAGITKVTASLNNSSQSVDATFIADAGRAQLKNDALTVLINNSKADGVANNKVQAKVVDSYNNPVPNVMVNFSVNNGASLITASQLTGEDGLAITTLTSVKTGKVIVTATVNNSSRSIDTLFVADGSTAKLLSESLKVLEDNAKANGKAQNKVQVIVVDAMGNRVPGASVSFSANSGAVIKALSQVTNDAGVVEATLTSERAGVAKVTAELNGSKLQVDTTFKADETTAAMLPGALVVKIDNAIADGIATNKVQAKVTDAKGNPVPDVVVAFSADNGAKLLSTSPKTDRNGVIEATVTSKKALVVMVTAKIRDSQQSVNTTFKANENTATLSASDLSIIKNHAVADEVDTNRVKARVTDANGNPLPNMVVVFSADSGARVLPVSPKTDINGVMEATITSKKAVTVNVTAKIRESQQTVSTLFKANENTVTLLASNLSIVKNNAVADETDTNRVKAKVTDANGNPVPDMVVVFSADNGAQVKAVSTKTDSNGVMEAEITSKRAITIKVTAKIGNSQQSVSTLFKANENTVILLASDLSIVKNNAVADETDVNRVKAKVTDVNGNPVPDMVVVFSADNGAKVKPVSAKTDLNGIMEATLTSRKAVVVKVTAKIRQSQQTIDTIFKADESSASIWHGRLEVVEDNAIADGIATNRLRARVTDRFGNPVPNITPEFSADNEAVTKLVSQKTDSDGLIEVTVTSKKAVTVWVKGKIGNTQTVAPTNFKANKNTAKLLDGDISVVKDGAVADGRDTNRVKVKVTDANGNPVRNVVVAFSADNGAKVKTVNSETNNSGVIEATLTSTKAVMVKVTAKINGSEQSVNTTFQADKSTATLLTDALSVVENNATANGTATNKVKARVTDASGNPVPDMVVVFSADNGAQVKAIDTKTNSQGVMEATLTSTKAVVVKVTAAIGTSRQSVNTTFNADKSTAKLPEGALSVVVNNATANGTATNQVKATVTDTNGNPVPDVVVVFSADNGAQVKAIGTKTNSQGVMEAMLTSKQAVVVKVTARINGSEQSVNTAFNSDDSTAKLPDGALSVVVNNATANGTATNQVQAKVTDANGNPVPGVAVIFIADNHANVNPVNTKTDLNGVIKATLTSKKAGVVKVTAKINGSEQSVNTTFKADESTAKLLSGALSVVANNATANGTATNKVQAMVTDASGNPVPGVVVVFSADNDAQVKTVSAKTDLNGVMEATLTSKKAVVVKVIAKINGSEQSVNTLFKADESTAKLPDGALSVVVNNATANGTAINKVQARVADASGNPVPGVAVVFSADNDAQVKAVGAKTDLNGMMEATLTSKKAVVVKVTAKINGSEQSVNTTFQADESTVKLPDGALSVVVNNATANGTATNKVQARVIDANGNPVPGVAVTFSADNDARVQPVSPKTDGNGMMEATLTSRKAVVVKVTATIGNSQQSVNTLFKADESTAALISGALSVVVNNATANGIATNKVQARVTDANGNPVPNMEVVFSVNNDAKITLVTQKTDSNGAIEATVSSIKAVAVKVTAKIRQSQQSVDIMFRSDESTAELISGALSVVVNHATANGIATNKVKARVTDDNGNPVPGVAVTFSADNNARLQLVSPNTDSNGIMEATLTSTKAMTVKVTAAIGNSQQSVSTSFKADESTAKLSAGALSVVVNHATANGTATNQVQARVTDANGNPVPGMAVVFSADNDAQIKTVSAKTDLNGIIKATLTSKKAVVVKVTAKINGSEQSVNTTFEADESTAKLSTGTLSVVVNHATANGTATNKVQATVTDANGNPVPGVAVVFSADNHADIKLVSSKTDLNGVMEATLTSRKAVVVKVTAKINGSEQNVNITFKADESTAKLSSSALSVMVDHATANGTATNQVQAMVTDANGNPVPGMAVVFSANNDAQVKAVSAKTDLNGVIKATLTSKKAVVVKVTAKISGSEQSINTTFDADESTAALISGALSVVVDHATANGTAANKVQTRVTDANGNPVPGVAVTFSADNDAKVTLITHKTDSNGVMEATLTSKKAVVVKVIAKINGSEQSVNTTFEADESTAKLSAGTLSVVVNHATANGAATNQVQAMVSDANGNPVPGVAVTFSADNDAQMKTVSARTDLNGVIKATLTSKKAVVVKVTAKINGSEQSVNTLFKADESTAKLPDGALKVVANHATANGTATNKVQAKVTDANGNPVPDMMVVFSADNGAQVKTVSATTNSHGIMEATLTSKKAVVVKVTAKINGSEQSVNTLFKADESTATLPEGALSVVENNATANGMATNKVQAKVTDASGNPVPGVVVVFSADNDAQMKIVSAKTDLNGVMEATLTSKQAVVVKVTANINGSKQSVNTLFKADESTAKLPDGALSVVVNHATANGTATNKVQAKVTDVNGNPVPDVVVVFSADKGAQVKALSAKTNNHGIMEATLTSKQAVVVKVTANINGSKQSVNTLFKADESTAKLPDGALSVVVNNATANGTATNKVQAKVTDENGNPVPDMVVVFSADNGAQVRAVSAKTDLNGVMEATLTSKKAVVVKVTAKINGSEQSVNTLFKADESTATLPNGALSVVENNATANGTATNKVKARVTDASGNPVPDVVVVFSADNGAQVRAVSAKTDRNGVMEATLTSKKAVVVKVTATIGNSQQSVNTLFKADQSTATLPNGALSVVVNNATANGTATNQVKATVTDANGNPVPDVVVVFSADSGAQVKAISAKTDRNGVMEATLTSKKAVVVKVVAKINGSEQSVNTLFKADEGTAKLLTDALSVVVNHATANGKATNQVQATVTDASGNPVPDVVVVFSADNDAQVKTVSAKTDLNGIIKATLTSTKAVVVKVTAKINGSEQSVDTTFKADESTAQLRVGALSVVVNNATANGIATNQVQATVTDASGNPVPNMAVVFSADNSAKVKPLSTQTDLNGVIKATLTSTKAVVVKVTAKINDSEQSVNTLFKADESTAQLSEGALSVVVNNATANGMANNQVQARVTDASGNPVPNVAVVFSADNSAKVKPLSTQTDLNGVIKATLTSTKAVVVKVTAKINGSEQSVNTLFKADESTAKLSEGALSVVVNHATANGTATNQVQARVTDASGNPVPGVVVTFSANNDAQVKSISPKTDSNGVIKATLTSKKAVEVKVTATIGSSQQSVTTLFRADESTAQLRVGALSVVMNHATANGTATNKVQAKVTDAGGNPVPNVVVVFSTNNDAQIQPVSSKTDSKGVIEATLTSKKAVEVKVTAKINGSEQSVNTLFKADESTAKLFDGALSVVVDNAVANGHATNQVRARVTDANGNPLPGVVVNFSASNRAKINPLSTTTDINGVMEATLTSRKAMVIKVIAEINGSEQSVNTTFNVEESTARLIAGALSVVVDNAIADEVDTNKVQAKVIDANGNPVPGVVVKFSADKDAQIQPVSPKTDSKGMIEATLTSKKAVAVAVTAEINESKQTVNVKFTGDIKTAVITTVTLDGAVKEKVANGTDSFTFTALVTDKNNNVLANQLVQWEHNKGALATFTAATKSGQDGKATVKLVSTKAEALAIEVKAFLADKPPVAADKKVAFIKNTVKVHGVISNAVDKKVLVKGADVKIYDKTNNQLISETTSNNKGEYSVDIKPGTYVLKLKKSGYEPTDNDLTIPDVLTYLHNVAMSPSLKGDMARIILSWKSTPRDYDSHLLIPKNQSTYVTANYVTTDKGRVPVENVYLDRDDADYNGTETMTIKKWRPGTYCFAANAYTYDAGSKRIKDATVQLLLADGTNKVFSINDANKLTLSSYDGWTVFKLVVTKGDDGSFITQVLPVNRVQKLTDKKYIEKVNNFRSLCDM